MYSAPEVFQFLSYVAIILQVYLSLVNSGFFSMVFHTTVAIIHYIASAGLYIVVFCVVYPLIGYVLALIGKEPISPLTDTARAIQTNFYCCEGLNPKNRHYELITNLWATDSPEEDAFWMGDAGKADGLTAGSSSPANFVLNTPPYLIRGASGLHGPFRNIKDATRSSSATNPPTAEQRLQEDYLFFSKWSIATFYYYCKCAAIRANGDYDFARSLLAEQYKVTK